MSLEHPLDERELIASWGYDVCWIGGIGSYVGEWMALLRDPGPDAATDRWGFLWIGHTTSTDRDPDETSAAELALPSCSWECRGSPDCPHDWSAIETRSRLERDSIEWADRATLVARLHAVRAGWDGPSSRDSADRAVEAMLNRLVGPPRS